MKKLFLLLVLIDILYAKCNIMSLVEYEKRYADLIHIEDKPQYIIGANDVKCSLGEEEVALRMLNISTRDENSAHSIPCQMEINNSNSFAILFQHLKDKKIPIERYMLHQMSNRGYHKRIAQIVYCRDTAIMLLEDKAKGENIRYDLTLQDKKLFFRFAFFYGEGWVSTRHPYPYEHYNFISELISISSQKSIDTVKSAIIHPLPDTSVSPFQRKTSLKND